MQPENGAWFLAMLLSSDQFPMDGNDLEKAILIASKKSPSGAFDAGREYYQMRHGSFAEGHVGFAKGTRWLAVIRRSQGQAVFDAAVALLRQVMPVPYRDRRALWPHTTS